MDIESAYWELVIKDIKDACKLFEDIYDQTDAGDGYVSVEVSPKLANETEATVEAAKWLHKVVNCRNVYIKIPATAECIPSIRDVIANGISVNVTVSSIIIVLCQLIHKKTMPVGVSVCHYLSLNVSVFLINSNDYYIFMPYKDLIRANKSNSLIYKFYIHSVQLIFSLPRYEAVMDAYIDGLEASGLSDLSKITSVASFFVSRVDTLIDKKLEKIGTPEALALRGKVKSKDCTLGLGL